MSGVCLPVVHLCTSSVPGAGDLGSAIGSALVTALTGTVDHLAADLVQHVFSLVGNSMSIQLQGEGWFTNRFSSMATLAAVLVTPLLVAGTASAVLHQDPRRLARTWLVALPVAAVATFTATDFTQLALQAADQMTALVTANTNLDVYNVLSTVGAAGGGVPGLDTILAVVLLLGALAVWLELVVRSAAVYVALFFLPLALAAMVWPSTAHMARRLLEGLASLILMKFVIVTTLSLGAAAVQYGHGADQVATGAAILLIAAFSPYVLFRMVPIVESATLDHFAGLSRQPFRAAMSTAARITSLVGSGGTALAAAGGAGDAAKVTSTAAPPGAAPQAHSYATGPADWGGPGHRGGGQAPVDTTARDAPDAPTDDPAPPSKRDLGILPGPAEPPDDPDANS